ncbi:MAG: serine/threonine-protein kinase, partial [Myxococcota bacterium]
MSGSFPQSFGQYELLERLAVGGMAEIFLARPSNASVARPTVVIKRLLPHMADDPQFNAMFLDEARLGKRLTHPNIVKTYEFGFHKDELFIAMEYVDGLDALALLRECAHRKVRMPSEVAVYIVRQVLEALDYAHNHVDDEGNPLGLVHRDISPSNVLLSRRGEVKLVDFGIARAAQQTHKTQDGTLKGKYGYMSPEQVVDSNVDARSDIFSVGIVLGELLTGRRLFAAANELDVLLMVRDAKLDRLNRYGGHLGMDLDRILRKALNKKIADRFPTAGAFRDVLSEWLSMHRHEVTPLVIAQIVESLYRDAWHRKRQAMVANSQSASQPLLDLSDSDDESSLHSVTGPRSARSRRAPTKMIDDEYSEPSEVDGIPIGRVESVHSDSLPVVSIEDESNDGVVMYEIEQVETNRMPGYDRAPELIEGTSDSLLDSAARAARAAEGEPAGPVGDDPLRGLRQDIADDDIPDQTAATRDLRAPVVIPDPDTER